MSHDRIGRLIEVGLDREAARLAVRDAVATDDEGPEVSSGPREELGGVDPVLTEECPPETGRRQGARDSGAKSGWVES